MVHSKNLDVAKAKENSFFQAITLNGTLYCHIRKNWCAFSYYVLSFSNYGMAARKAGFSEFKCSNTHYIHQDPVIAWRGPARLENASFPTRYPTLFAKCELQDTSALRIHVIHDCKNIYPWETGLHRSYKVLPKPNPKKTFSRINYYVDVILSYFRSQEHVLTSTIGQFANHTKTKIEGDIKNWMEGKRINVTKFIMEHSN